MKKKDVNISIKLERYASANAEHILDNMLSHMIVEAGSMMYDRHSDFVQKVRDLDSPVHDAASIPFDCGGHGGHMDDSAGDCPKYARPDCFPGAAFEFSANGSLEYTKDQINISVEDEIEDERTNFIFSRIHPDTVYMLKGEQGQVVYTFEKDKRCMYGAQSPYQTFNVCVQTKKLRNEIDIDGGEFFVSYTLELNGSVAESAEITLNVEPLT